jgi:hypothetical protein
VTRSRKPSIGKKYTEERKKNILASYRKLRADGDTHETACQKLGPNPKTVKAWLKQYPFATDGCARGEPKEQKPRCRSLVMKVDVDTTRLQEALEELKNASKSPSRREIERLCEEYEECHKKFHELSVPTFSAAFGFSEFKQHYRTGRVAVNQANAVAGDALQKRMSEIRKLIGQDFIDAYREWKKLERRLADAEDSITKIHRRITRTQDVLWVVGLLAVVAPVVLYSLLK